MIAALVAVSVTIVPGSYVGNYWVDSEAGGPNVGNLTIDLNPSVAHFIDDGVFAGASAFTFSVDTAGNVTVDPTFAIGGAGTLTFNTCNVSVDPGAYVGRWYSSSEHFTPKFGPQTLALVPALQYYVDDGSFAAPPGLPGSGFDYILDSSCNVTSVFPAGPAAASGAALTFNTTSLSVNPGSYAGSYVWSGDNVTPLTGINVLTFIDGLSVYLQVAGQAVYFVPGPATLAFTAATLTLSLAGASSSTPAGSGVPVTVGAATLSFSSVTSPGTTSAAVSGKGQAPPQGFRLGRPPTYYDITTTATYSGSIQICFDYAGVSYRNPSRLKLFHLVNGVWTDVTTSNDVANTTICGVVTSLSPFAAFEEGIEVTIDIDPHVIDLDSEHSVRVTIFSTPTFDARTVNPSTLELASAAVRMRKNGSLEYRFRDGDEDGLVDLVVDFDADALDLGSTDTQATLTGETFGGDSIVGSDSVIVVQ